MVLDGIAERLGSTWQGVSSSLNRRRIAKWATVLPKIASYESELEALSSFDLRKRSLSLRYRLKSHEPVDNLLPEAFALVREAGRRALNMRHFDVQMLGGMAMHHRSIAEMQTGEGKTLTATLPLYLAALEGKGAHLATVNDYLARRDAEWMKPIYESLGLTVGIVETQMSQPNRRQGLCCDITYGTAKEFGFDFLRDRLLLRRIGEGQTDFLGGMLGVNSDAGGERPVQRTPFFVLVDEADSILIDEARTPLIISALPSEAAADRGGSLQVGGLGGQPVRRGRTLRLRSRTEVDRTDRRRAPPGPHVAQARRDARGGHVQHLRIHRAGSQGRPRVLSRSAIRRSRRRGGNRRRIHRPHGRRPQVAGRLAPGRGSQPGRTSKCLPRQARPRGSPCRTIFSSIRSWRHDRHRHHLGRRAEKDLQAAA